MLQLGFSSHMFGVPAPFSWGSAAAVWNFIRLLSNLCLLLQKYIPLLGSQYLSKEKGRSWVVFLRKNRNSPIKRNPLFCSETQNSWSQRMLKHLCTLCVTARRKRICEPPIDVRMFLSNPHTADLKLSWLLHQVFHHLKKATWKSLQLL